MWRLTAEREWSSHGCQEPARPTQNLACGVPRWPQTEYRQMLEWHGSQRAKVLKTISPVALIHVARRTLSPNRPLPFDRA